ncbi:hypothetical protein EDB83DRAFT_2358265, partial [Lactarius deliciosus]
VQRFCLFFVAFVAARPSRSLLVPFFPLLVHPPTSLSLLALGRGSKTTLLALQAYWLSGLGKERSMYHQRGD